MLPEDEPYSFQIQWQQALQRIKAALGQVRTWMLVTVAGIVVGLVLAWLSPVTYTARLSFVVEDAKTGGGSIMSALAGQFGFDIGSLSGGASGVLAGDNVLELVRSQHLIKKTLLTPVDSNKQYSLADLYADTYGWKEKWKNSSKVGKQVDFTPGLNTFGRLGDSLLQRIIKQIGEKELSIAKPDRKLGFFEMQTTMRNEQLSQLFCKRLLQESADFYIETKTRRLSTNVKRLQAKADSLQYALNRKTYSAADASRMLLDVNPAYTAPEVTAEISSRDKVVQGTIYAEIVKNLEIIRKALIQETPTVQVVDTPELPLKKNELHWWMAAAAGGAIGFAASVLLLAWFYRKPV